MKRDNSNCYYKGMMGQDLDTRAKYNPKISSGIIKAGRILHSQNRKIKKISFITCVDEGDRL